MRKKRQRNRGQHRMTSNVFNMFNQDQIQEFKEAFKMIDQVWKLLKFPICFNKDFGIQI